MNNLTKNNIELSPAELDEIGRVYQVAFAGPPWFEVSKCVSLTAETRCISGFSQLKVGEFCTKCALRTTKEAYPLEELRLSLADRLRNPGARLYREYDENFDLLLAALFWEDTPTGIAEKKYVDVPQMQAWLKGSLPDESLIWLDEIFADQDSRPGGNLWNFPNLVADIFSESACSRLAFRTINEGLLAKSQKSFGAARILSPGKVPDRRSFVIIDKEKK